MHSIIYISESTTDSKKIEETLQNIEKTANAFNAKHNITGVLFFQNGLFLQILEGKKSDLDILLQQIGKDPRHKNIEYLINCPLDSRIFDDWSMQSFNLENNKKLSLKEIQITTKAFHKTIFSQKNENTSNKIYSFYKALID